MKKSELRKIIEEELLKESTGGYLSGIIEDMEMELLKLNISGKDYKEVHKKFQDFVKELQAAAKDAGLKSW